VVVVLKLTTQRPKCKQLALFWFKVQTLKLSWYSNQQFVHKTPSIGRNE